MGQEPPKRAKLSRAVRTHLTAMLDAQAAGEWDNAEIVCDNNQCWLGLTRVSRRTVNQMVRDLLVSYSQSQQVERYRPSGLARHVLAREALLGEVREAISNGVRFSIDEEARLVPLK